MNLFIYGYYGFGNVGDDLLLDAIVSKLQEEHDEATFVVRSLGKVQGLALDQNIRFTEVDALLLDRSLGKKLRFIKYIKACWRDMKGATHCLIGGGTLIHAESNPPWNLIIVLAILLMAKMRGMKSYVIGIGVLQLKSYFARVLLRLIGMLVADFAVRDDSSFDNTINCISPGKLRLTGDLVFSLHGKLCGRDISTNTTGGRTVAITLASSALSGIDLQQCQCFTKQFWGAIQVLFDSGWKVQLWSFQELEMFEEKLSDFAVMTTSAARSGVDLHACDRIRVTADATHLKALYGCVDVVVGMRFHALVLAALMDVPFMGIAFDAKVRDLCNYFNMPFLHAAELSSAEVASEIDRSLSCMVDKSKIKTLETLSGMNFDVLLNELDVESQCGGYFS